MRIEYKKIRRVLVSFFCFLLSAASAHAAQIIRDAEIEHTLKTYAKPILKAAGLEPSAVRIFIVQDDALNAFVAGGSNIFLHTGLIMRTPTPDMLLGVMAHETGHISGGHLARGAEKLKDAQIGTILTYIAGAAAAAATKNTDAAAAVIAGGATTLGRNFLAYTRTHEESADQAALRYLDKTNTSAAGMLKVFALLERHERESGARPDPYLLTHPLSSSRIEHVRDHVQKSSIPEGQFPKAYAPMHQRMIAKLYGFLETPERTLQKYPKSDKSAPARMARAVAYYKMPDIEAALAEMNTLLEGHPNDPFFHELKGQILFENGRVKEALESYERALVLLPGAPLILTDVGRVALAQEPPQIKLAIERLEQSASLDTSNADTWHFLAIAYGKSGEDGRASLAQAEKSSLKGDMDAALDQVNRALDTLKEFTPARQRALDLKTYVIDQRKKMRDAEAPF